MYESEEDYLQALSDQGAYEAEMGAADYEYQESLKKGGQIDMNQDETAKCDKCGNVNKVLVSTGHNKPENKGKKYFTCAGCGQFQWVEGKATPAQVAATEKAYDNEAVGKVRHGVSIAVIEKIGGKPTPEIKEQINEWVEFIMTGK